MSSEVEISLDITARSQTRNSKRFLDSAGNDTEERVRHSLFASLAVCHDVDSRTAALNMAIDEALFEGATRPTIRFYRWNHPALSFGYFGRFAAVKNHESQRDIVRRWTGGGIVFHGEDLTYSIIIPVNDPAFAESSMSLYEKIHRAVCGALAATRKGDFQIALAVENRHSWNAAVIDRRYNECFANPVRADVLWNGQKVAGAAQRRTRGGLLQQGSIQAVELANDFWSIFTAQLSENCVKKEITNVVLDRALEISDQKYGNECWLRKR